MTELWKVRPLRPAIIIALTLAPGIAVAQDIGRGKLLYETFCVSCHDKSVHARGQKLAKSYPEIRAQVNRWQSNIGQSWSASEIEDVTAYLNHSIYSFPEKPIQ